MTDLTRERLAELRGFAENDMVGHHLHTWIEPSEVLSLIAQCEAGLPASGGVSGEDGELSADVQKALIRLRMDDPRVTDQTPRAKAITTLEHALRALLAERDGLERGYLDAAFGGDDCQAALSASNAALSDALGLLREVGTAESTNGMGVHRPTDWYRRRAVLLGLADVKPETETP